MSAPYDAEVVTSDTYFEIKERLETVEEQLDELEHDRDYWRARCEEAETIVLAYGKALRVFEQSLMGRLQA